MDSKLEEGSILKRADCVLLNRSFPMSFINYLINQIKGVPDKPNVN
jgi:hypothetical protein